VPYLDLQQQVRDTLVEKARLILETHARPSAGGPRRARPGTRPASSAG